MATITAEIKISDLEEFKALEKRIAELEKALQERQFPNEIVIEVQGTEVVRAVAMMPQCESYKPHKYASSSVCEDFQKDDT